jgi:hypothetical protein
MRRLLLELRAALGGFGSGRLMTLTVAWVLMIGSALLGALYGCCRARTFVLIAPVFAMSAFFAAFSLGASLQVMLVDLRRLCAPGQWRAHAGRAIGAVLLLSVLAPATALALLQRSVHPAGMLAGAALFGLLFARLARSVGVTLIILSFAVVAAHGSPVANYLADYLPVLSGRLVPGWLNLVLLAALVGWLWRPVLAGNATVLESASRRVASWRGGAQSLSSWSSGWFPTASRQSSPRRPVRIVCACLGPMYLPLSRAGLRMTVQAGLASVLLTQVPFLLILGWHRYWRLGVLICLLAVWILFAVEVSKVLQRAGGELAELASLPGLGSRRSQLRTLWRASISTPLLITMLLSALALFAARTEHPTWSASVDVLRWLGTTAIFGLACMASVLARRSRMWPDWTILVFLAAALAVWVLVDPGPPRTPVWLVLPIAAGLVLIVNARRLESFPHPFVLRA